RRGRRPAAATGDAADPRRGRHRWPDTGAAPATLAEPATGSGIPVLMAGLSAAAGDLDGSRRRGSGRGVPPRRPDRRPAGPGRSAGGPPARGDMGDLGLYLLRADRPIRHHARPGHVDPAAANRVPEPLSRARPGRPAVL